MFTRPFIQTQIKVNIKAPRHWPLCGEFTGTGEFPAQRASYAENVSIWWRHHDLMFCRDGLVAFLLNVYWVICLALRNFIYLSPFYQFAFSCSELNKVLVCHAVCHISWCRHQIETFSALLAICAGNSPVPGDFPAQRPMARSFDVFFDLRPNKRLSKHSWGWLFETLSLSLWRHCNVISLAFFTDRAGLGIQHSHITGSRESWTPFQYPTRRLIFKISWCL